MQKTNYPRRILGVLIALLPAVPLLSALIAPTQLSTRETALAFVSLVPGAACAMLNFTLSIVRPWLYRRRHGSTEGLTFVSGIPVLGTLSTCVAVYLGWGSVHCASIVLALCLVDTLSPTWFVIATWRDTSLWDA